VILRRHYIDWFGSRSTSAADTWSKTEKTRHDEHKTTPPSEGSKHKTLNLYVRYVNRGLLAADGPKRGHPTAALLPVPSGDLMLARILVSHFRSFAEPFAPCSFARSFSRRHDGSSGEIAQKGGGRRQRWRCEGFKEGCNQAGNGSQQTPPRFQHVPR